MTLLGSNWSVGVLEYWSNGFSGLSKIDFIHFRAFAIS
jgi:hypothetical protein